MLGPEHVRVKKRKDVLELAGLEPKVRKRALALAEAALAVTARHLGEPREALERAWAGIEAKPSERRLLDGLVKLVEDTCSFKSPEGFDPSALRSALFLRAAAVRRALAPGERLDRDALLAEVARELGLSVSAAEEGLYCDLRGAQRLLAVEPLSAEALVERYERAQVQAVLLRAVRIRADIVCTSPDTYRALFHKLKFRQLLHRIEPRAEGGYRIEIDGPMSLFEATTKYGLELALVVPALLECDAVDLVAELRWGKRREPLSFQLRHRRAPGATERDRAEPRLRDEVRELMEAVNALGGDFSAAPATEIVELPGLGLCVPDLEFVHRPSGSAVLCEVLGFWSREAVFKRIELAQRGLPVRLLFVASARLRVSEALLDGVENSALYVYKGKINVRALLRHLEALV